MSTWSVFSLRRYQIRREVKYQIKKGVPAEAQTRLYLSFTQMTGQDFVWVNDHEFRYQGQMFDVLSQKPTATGIEFFCLKDEDETILFRTLDDQVAGLLQQDAGTREQSARTITFYQQWVFIPAQSLVPVFCMSEKETCISSRTFCLPPGHRNEIFAPPETLVS